MSPGSCSGSGPDLFHAPHYVLPPAVPCRSVVTIQWLRPHLMFPRSPQPRRVAGVRARATMWAAAKRSDTDPDGVRGLQRDILRFFHVPPEKVVVVSNAIDERFWDTPKEEAVARVRERYHWSEAPIRPLRREHQAPQPRPADRRPRRAPEQRVRGPQAARRRRRDLEAPGPAPRGARAQAAQARAVPRVHARTTRSRSCSPCRGLCVFPSVRRLWPAPSRGHGKRVRPVVTSNVSSLPEVAGDAAVLVDPTDAHAICEGIRRVLTDPPWPRPCVPRGLCERVRSWERSVARTCELYQEVGGATSCRAWPSCMTGSRACAAERECSRRSASSNRARTSTR